MRSALLAFTAICLLAACGQNTQNAGSGSNGSGASATAPSGTSGGMPVSTIPYRADMTMTVGGRTMPATMFRSGANSRTEMESPAGHTVMIMNGDNHEGYSMITVAGRVMATRIDLSTTPTAAGADWKPEDVAAATRGGPCTAAGESGTEYTRTTDNGSFGGCVTNDGIILRTSMNGHTVMEATRIQRGPQDPSLFVLPPGVHASDAGAAIRDAMAAAQAKGH